MTERRRRGVFEGLPRALFRLAGPRYLEVLTAAGVGNGLVVAAFGVLTLALYADLPDGTLGTYALVSAAGYVVEGVAAGAVVRRRVADPAAPGAWTRIAGLPEALLRSPLLLALGLLGAAASVLVLDDGLWPAPLALLLYASSAILRFVALDLSVRPLLERIGDVPLDIGGVSLHRRLVVLVPMVTWGTAMLTAGLLTEDTAGLRGVGEAALVAFAVSAVVSTWVSFVLGDSIVAPVVDLRDATRRVGEGDLAVRVPVVARDETGQLARSFNDMVAGLDERERLREAFGEFVDPAIAERVLTEGTDLAGEEVEVTVLVVDVRGFTTFAERATPRDLVAHLNRLYETIVPLILEHGGHANKFIGDGLLAVFGAPERHVDHAERAVAAARAIAAATATADGPMRVGVGVNTGRVVVGTIGGGGRRDFTVIGDAVNTASRVEGATRETGDDVLITEATWRAIGAPQDGFIPRDGVVLRGKVTPLRLFAPRV